MKQIIIILASLILSGGNASASWVGGDDLGTIVTLEILDQAAAGGTRIVMTFENGKNYDTRMSYFSSESAFNAFLATVLTVKSTGMKVHRVWVESGTAARGFTFSN